VIKGCFTEGVKKGQQPLFGAKFLTLGSRLDPLHHMVHEILPVLAFHGFKGRKLPEKITLRELELFAEGKDSFRMLSVFPQVFAESRENSIACFHRVVSEATMPKPNLQRERK
jgi:hypothetical protein